MPRLPRMRKRMSFGRAVRPAGGGWHGPKSRANNAAAGWPEPFAISYSGNCCLRPLCSPPPALVFIYTRPADCRTGSRAPGLTRLMGPLGEREALAPAAQIPFFFREIGKTFRPKGEKRYRVAFLAGCIANISFARLNEATVRVLQKNGCEVVIPAGQTCCGALHVHAGIRDEARRLARRNIDAVLDGGFDAIITNAAGCGSTLKEYDELLEHDPQYAERARKFKSLMKDVTEFLAAIELNLEYGARERYRHLSGFLPSRARAEDPQSSAPASGRDSGARNSAKCRFPISAAAAPEFTTCCTRISRCRSSKRRWRTWSWRNPQIIATANPGCMIQLEAGVRKWGAGERVVHVVELLDEAYRARAKTNPAVTNGPKK